MINRVATTEDDTGAVRLLYLAAWLWLGYLLLFFAIDRLFVRNPPAVWYYAVNALNALLVLGLAWWPRARALLGRAFLPVEIGLLSALPILANHLLASRSPLGPGPGGVGGGGGGGPFPLPGPTTSAEGMALRLLPVLLMALALTAWRYRWPQVVLFSLGTAGLTLGLLLSANGPGGLTLGLLLAPDGPPPGVFAGVLVAVVQTFSFLAVGYFICALMGRLRAQQAELAQANARLVDHASTLESLAVSRERNRMARELHDTLAHTLSGLAVQLETVEAYWNVEPQTAHALLDKALAATRDGLQETRRALRALRASPLDDLGLGLALRRMAESAVARANVQLDLEIPEQVPPLAPEVEQCVYRVAQEAVANAVQHANARGLAVRLACADGETRLVVRDDGMGFERHEPEVGERGTARQNGHFGLEGMRERAHLVGGQLAIVSGPGLGTMVELRVRDRGPGIGPPADPIPELKR